MLFFQICIDPVLFEIIQLFHIHADPDFSVNMNASRSSVDPTSDFHRWPKPVYLKKYYKLN